MNEMNNTFIKGDSLKVYEESTYTWTLHFSETWRELRHAGHLYCPIFPEKKNKWQGMLCFCPVSNNYGVKLLLNANETIHIKHTLLVKNKHYNVGEVHGEFTDRDKKKWEDFKCCNTLIIPKDDFSYEYFIVIEVIIQENVAESSKAICGANIAQETKKNNCGTNTSYEINASESLKNDLKMMFENKEFSDFIIKLKDFCEIPVHKSILAARSPVFLAMFKNDTLEKNTAYVNITDIDKNTMMMLLNFIYTGNVTFDLSVEEAKNLLSAANKYAILDLKRICGKYLESNLEISNAIDMLLLSELYNVSELKNCVFELIIEKKESFLDPVKFEKVGKQFPNLMIELVMKVFVDKT